MYWPNSLLPCLWEEYQDLVKDPVHTAGSKIDRESGICKTLIWKICMYVRGKSTPQIRMMHKKQGRKNSFCFTAWIKSIKLWK